MERPWLVTGAAGFLGSHVVEHLVAQGKNVLALDDLSGGCLDYLEPFGKSAQFRLLRLDMRRTDELSLALRRYRPCVAIHLAALHFIPAAVANPAQAVSLNVHGTQSVLSACLAAEVQRFWFASTGDVYAPAETPHREDDRIAPFNIYGLTKLMGEQLVALQAQQCPDTHFVIGRLFNLYGPRETNPHILPEILQQIRARPDAPLQLGNIWPRRDLVPVAEAARAVIDMVERAPAGVTTCNVATGSATSMEQVIELLGVALGRALHVQSDACRVRPVERAHLQADVTRLRQLIGWTPHADVRLGLTDLLTAEGLTSMPLACAVPGSGVL
jgi:UDP-glucose 4-epimerase